MKHNDKNKIATQNNNKFKNFSQLKQDFLNNFKKTFKRIETLYILGIFFYILSLHHINGYEMVCFNRNGVNCFFMIVKLLSLSSIIICIAIYIIIIKKYKKIHLFNISIIYIFLLLIDHSTGIIKHGLFNFIFFFIITLLIFFIIFLIK